jgi:hypothetical protein
VTLNPSTNQAQGTAHLTRQALNQGNVSLTKGHNMNRLEKGLIVNAARKMGWIIRNHRFHFTVTDEIRPGKRERSKACTPKPDGKDKYLWHEGSSVTYYHAPNIQSEIDKAGGVVIFAAGEPDVLTFLEAGIHNVISWFGEGNVPKTLAEDMKALGVREILYWPDRDKAGKVSGRKVRAATRDTDIACKIFELPAHLGDKADTNDLWVYHRGNQEAFKADLTNCKALVLPNDEKPVKHTDSGNYEQTSDELIQLICNHWNLTEFAADGFSKQTVPVPFRADQNPSGAFNRHSGVLLDRATSIGYAKWKVAKALGIEWKRQRPEKHNHQHRKNSPSGEKSAEASVSDIPATVDSSSDEKSPLWFLGTLPDSWRSAFCNYFKPSVAAVVELVHELARQGYIQPESFTLEQVSDQQMLVGFFLSAKTIREMITEELESFFPKNDIKSDTDSMPKKEKKLGRPSQTYRFASFETVKATILAFANPRIKEQHFPGTDPELLVTVFEAPMLEAIKELSPVEATELTTLLNSKTKDFRAKNEAQYKVRWKRAKRQYFALEASLSNLHSTELPPAPIRKAKDYKALFLRGQVEAGQDNRSGREIAQSLGMQRQSVNQILSHAGVESISQYERVSIDKSNVAKLDRIGYEVKGYPRTLHIDTQVMPYNPEQAASVINEAIEQGKEVAITYQVKNKQVIATDEIFPEKPADKVEKHPAEPVEKTEKERPANAEQRKEQRHYGPSFDPAWVKRQLVLALVVAKLGYIRRGAAILDTRTGETWDIEALSTTDIICLFRGQSLERNIA